MLKYNYHTHLKLCGHAIGMSEDYAKEAQKLGMIELGISDHAPILDNIMTKEEEKENYVKENMSYDDFLNVYIPDILSTREKYPNLKLHLGLETEYLPMYHDYYVKLREQLDYMILGVHFFQRDDKSICCTYNSLDKSDIILYAKTIERALDTGLFSILAHPDLFMYKYLSIDKTPRFDEICKEASLLIIDSAIRNNVLLELNAGGIKYGVKKIDNKEVYYYPREEFFMLAKEKNAAIIIGADAHDPKNLDDDGLKTVISLAKQWNLIIKEKIDVFK